MKRISILLFLFSYGVTILYGQAIDRSFISPLSTNDAVYAMALQPDGKIIVGGGFTTTGIISKKIVRLNANGSIDSSFNVGAGFNGPVNEITLQADGKVLVGGVFTAFNNISIKNLVRLLPNGTLDNTFNIGTGVDGNNNSVQTIEVDESGRIYVGGDITRFNGKATNTLIRLNENGTLDASFNSDPNYTGRIITIAFQSDGKILAGGLITKTNYINAPVVMIRLNANGSLDSNFQVSSTSLGSVNSIKVLPDNKILIGGDFHDYNGKPYSSIVRLLSNGGIDESFVVGRGFRAIYGGIYSLPLYIVSDMAVTAEGKIVVGGFFNEYNGTNVDGIIQLNSDGSISNTFQPCRSDGLNGKIYNVNIQPDGKILVGGYFGDFRKNSIATNVFRVLPIPIPGSSEPVSDFDYIPRGKDVAFVNTSTNGNSFRWDFNDGTISRLSNPLHKYKSPGSYHVSLTTVGQCDNAITSTKTVRILDIREVFPKRGGNTGIVTLKILGTGFGNKSKVTLNNTNNVIVADTVFVNNDTELICYFNLNKKTIGSYDVVVEEKGVSKRLPSAFTVEKGEKINLFVDLIGRSVIRGGRKEIYQLSFGNKGNNDAFAIPLFILGIPKDAKWTMNINVDTIIDDSTNAPLEYTTDDSSKVIALLINRLPSQSSFAVNLSIEVPPTGADFKLTAWINNSIADASILQARVSRNSSNEEDCFEDFIDFALDRATEVLIPKECIAEGVKIFRKTIQEYRGDNGTFDPLHPDFATAYGKHALETLKAIATCAGDISIGRGKEIYEVFIEPFLKAHDIWEAGDNALACLFSIVEKIHESIVNVKVVTSIDPNEKVGPKSYLDGNYITGTKPINYTIYFENKDSALAAAQEVVIIDTIDKSKVDVGTLQLQSYGFGKSFKVSIPSGSQSFFADTILKRTGKADLLLRVFAKIDTSTGILHWRFLSLDAKTGELINDPFDGFLPPNKNSPEGEGFVSYSISPKSTLTHKDEIKNKASIYFDYNDPITTNIFSNILDKVKPVSSISSMPSETGDTTFIVKWNGTDEDAGISTYTIYYALNNGPFQLLSFNTSADSIYFTGKVDSTYKFFSIAKDYVGNIEASKSSAEATIRITRGVLPITSMPLQGILNQNLTVSLKWSTLTEANNKGFDIERNLGNGWVKIGFVKGAGNSTRKIDYTFIDSNVIKGKSYLYRYKQIDNDSHFAYSNSVTIKISNDKNVLSLTTAPNPFTGKTIITYNLSSTGNTTLRLMDYTGKEVAKIINGHRQAGVHQVELNATSLKLSAGTYFLNITNNHESVTSKIILIK